MTRDPGDATAIEYLTTVTALIEELTTAADPYDKGVDLWGRSAGADGELAIDLQLIWGALTDWVERRPAEGEQARAEMRRAAREWLALDRADRAAVERYRDRWVHDVCGYPR
ncbi:hypothetical protein BJY16_005397 [Actinoplanes octamycinicus]|uniref:Uncharacterized protein n=1 Tax=Actinoplanes octamycinicus TaxID=135948 RepID=A0A7W7H114_9ACTN|nr:hypothetical protein [Actinoplanes octamycinicus]MBB4741938.1 hypothetical protein [Actinoplanes octamycinicus]GIE60703.1 hypothetical protein Aoc01nite_61050 [Actinoplanes octamycinicus]